jgi:hypothetical protein
METSKAESLPPPPSVISSIKAGFDTITANLAAMLLPIILDLFLWLGPRLSMERLFRSLQPGMMAVWQASGVSAADIQKFVEWYQTTIPNLNLFWLLRTLPIGITSLMFAREFPRTPLGAPSIWQVSVENLFGWVSLLILLGWAGGALYFRWVARLSIKVAPSAPSNANAIPRGDFAAQDVSVKPGRAIVQTVMLSIFWSGISLILGLPIFILVSLLFQLNSFIAQVVLLAGGFLSMWMIVPFFFWPHGIFVKKQNALMSMLSSLQLARFTLPTSSMFVLTILLLGLGLNFVWGIPPADSWMTAVGILGHAFITTALLAASFIYYRDMNAWLQTVMERLKANHTVTKQA